MESDGLTMDSMVIHIAQELPAGIHLYDCVSGKDGTGSAHGGRENG